MSDNGVEICEINIGNVQNNLTVRLVLLNLQVCWTCVIWMDGSLTVGGALEVQKE